MPANVRIATRASELALRQARMVQSALESRGVASELVTFKTTGDKRLDKPLSEIGGKGLFTEELEKALLKGKVDCCVHSLKDLPTESPDGLEIVALLEREDPRDVVVLHSGAESSGLHDLPRGSRVGTSSLRRRAQLLLMRPDLEVVELRGNVPTRLRKVDEGQVHAAILAAAGLHRLNATQRIAMYLDAPPWLPAPGQGAIAVQARTDDVEMMALLSSLDHAATRVAVTAERAMLQAMDGGCQVPIGALASPRGADLVLHGMIADTHGGRVVRGECVVDVSAPGTAGITLAADLLSRGGDEILQRVRGELNVPSPQPE